ncbi:MAG: efflux RND transporter periplasmic adaptor subunit [Kangiellaceae bacterium]
MKKYTSQIGRLTISALFSLFILTSCGGDDSAKKQGKWPGAGKGAGARPTKTIPVEVSNPEVGLSASYYVTTATIEPSSDANINSRTSGVVKEVLREEGDNVKAGEVLLILDDDDQQLRLKQAEQELASAEREYKRLNKMKKAGVVSPTEYEAADNAFQVADTEKRLADLALSYTRVSAPFDGRVVWREVDLGAYVGQGQLLYRVMAINPLLVRLHIPANRLGMVAVGQAVELTVDTAGEPLQATVALVSPIVDPNTGTIKITLSLDDYPQSVRPGDFAQISMVTDKRDNALLLSSVAVIEERGQHYVYVVENGTSKRRSVELGFIMSDKTEIVSGVTKDEWVVTKGQRNLNDDVKVQVLAENGVATVSEKTKPANEGSQKKKANKKKRADS